MCSSHILSTAGDALTETAFWQKPPLPVAGYSGFIRSFVTYRVMPKEQGIPEVKGLLPQVADEGGLLFQACPGPRALASVKPDRRCENLKGSLLGGVLHSPTKM